MDLMGLLTTMQLQGQPTTQIPNDLQPVAQEQVMQPQVPTPKYLEFQRKIFNIPKEKQASLDFFNQYQDWQIQDVQDNPNLKTSTATLFNPNTKETKIIDVTGDKNVRTFNPGNVGTDTFKTGLGKGLLVKDVFKPIETKVINSKTAFPIFQKTDKGTLEPVLNSKKKYADKTLEEFVQTYLPRWNQKKNGPIIEENPLANQLNYLKTLETAVQSVQPEFDTKTGTIKDLNPEAKNMLIKAIFTQEGGVLKGIKEKRLQKK
jgi:hypothetical protein